MKKHPSDRSNFWHTLWAKNTIGFHQEEISPFLEKYWRYDQKKVFVPLCGKTKDMIWLSQKNHEVIGVEFNETAVCDFFTGTPYNTKKQNNMQVFYNKNIQIYCGDFFALPQIDTPLIFDRAALVALSQNLRQQYVNYLKKITPEDAKILLITYEYPQHEMPGPPFSIPQETVQDLYSKYNNIKKLDERNVLDLLPIFQKRLSFMKECVYSID